MFSANRQDVRILECKWQASYKLVGLSKVHTRFGKKGKGVNSLVETIPGIIMVTLSWSNLGLCYNVGRLR